MFTINDYSIIDCNLELPRLGAWTVDDVTIDTDVPFNIGDQVTIKFLDRELIGTVLDTGVFQGYQRCSIVGGSGLLPNNLESTPYNSTTVGQIVRDIARKTNHELSLESNQDVLNTNLDGWNIIQMRAALALTRLLKEVNAIWRILPDGKLWVGLEEYTQEVATGDFEIIEKHPEDSIWEVYNEDYMIDALTLFDGNPVKHITYQVSGDDVTTLLNFTDTYADTTDNLTDQDDEILYNGTYRCSVVTQHSDGSLDLLPNPYLEIIKNGFVNVPIIYPFPGMSIKVPTNTICYVSFANGDPQFPRVNGWDDKDNATKVEMIHPNAQPAARKTDTVDCGILQVTSSPMGTVVVYIPPGSIIPITIGPDGTQLKGIIDSGSSIVSIGT